MQIIVLFVMGLSFWAVSRGRSGWAAVPAVLTLLGLLLYLAGEPAPPGGGDGDPMRLTGTGLLVFAGPWTIVVLGVVAWRRRFPRRPGDAS